MVKYPPPIMPLKNISIRPVSWNLNTVYWPSVNNKLYIQNVYSCIEWILFIGKFNRNQGFISYEKKYFLTHVLNQFRPTEPVLMKGSDRLNPHCVTISMFAWSLWMFAHGLGGDLLLYILTHFGGERYTSGDLYLSAKSSIHMSRL